MPVRSSTRLTMAPGITWSELSTIVPVTLPVFCANALSAPAQRPRAARTLRHRSALRRRCLLGIRTSSARARRAHGTHGYDADPWEGALRGALPARRRAAARGMKALTGPGRRSLRTPGPAMSLTPSGRDLAKSLQFGRRRCQDEIYYICHPNDPRFERLKSLIIQAMHRRPLF